MALLALRRRELSTAAASSSSDAVTGFVTVAGIVGLLAYSVVAMWYAWDPHFFDNAEPTISSVAWMFQLGRPLYPALDAPERYAHIYGPMVFIVQGAALAWFGPSILVSKVVGAVGGLASLVFVFAAARRYASLTRSAVLTGLCALLLLTFRHSSFWNRPDSLQLLAVSAALYFAGIRPWPWASILVGVASGALWSLKFTGPLYSLPIFTLLYNRHGLRPVAIALATAAATAVTPFVLFSNVSLEHYLAWVRLSGQTGLLLSSIRQNIEWAAFVTLPLLLARVGRPTLPSHQPSSRLAGTALLAGVCGVVIAAAKPGAGPYHLMPFVPIVIYLLGQRLAARGASQPAFDRRCIPPGCVAPPSNTPGILGRRALPGAPQRGRLAGLGATADLHHGLLAPLAMGDPVTRRTIVAFIAVALVMALAQQTQLVSTMLARRTTHDVDDVVRFLDTHQGVTEMAYGRTETLSHARSLLTFRNNSYLIDQPAVREHQLQGLTVPNATVEAIARCRVKYWLVPKEEPPFSGANTYAAVLLQPLYPEVLRSTFAATHARREATDYYDVWECRGAAPR